VFMDGAVWACILTFHSYAKIDRCKQMQGISGKCLLAKVLALTYSCVLVSPFLVLRLDNNNWSVSTCDSYKRSPIASHAIRRNSNASGHASGKTRIDFLVFLITIISIPAVRRRITIHFLVRSSSGVASLFSNWIGDLYVHHCGYVVCTYVVTREKKERKRSILSLHYGFIVSVIFAIYIVDRSEPFGINSSARSSVTR
jgi:hypothetical protein